MWQAKKKEEVEIELKTDFINGLKDNEIKIRQEKYGYNKLNEHKKDSFIIKFLRQFKDFMIIILIIASIISAIVSYFEKSNDYFDSIIIIAIVIFNGFLGVLQEAKAEKSIEALKKISAPTAKVKRNGKTLVIDAEELVPGDIVLLETGNFVPADCRLINTFNFKVEESSLTGENIPAEKNSDVILDSNISIGDMKNMAFSGGIVTSGHADAVVTDTGMNTKVGKIAKMIIEDKSPDTPLQIKLSNVGKILGIACIIICVLVFIMGIIKKISPIEMFMTSVGLAVAAIPEGLPAIVTIMLSIGVTKMAKKNTIIRKLPAVETLGSCKVICSDKTGTLTQNKMTVKKFANANRIYDISDDYKKISIGKRFIDKDEPKEKNLNYSDEMEFLFRIASMCTTCKIETNRNKNLVIGEPTETAIVEYALKMNINKSEVEKEYPKVSEIPFESSRKLMTSIHRNKNGRYLIITKGAPDVLIEKCTKYMENNTEKNIDLIKKQTISYNNKKMAENALRVLAVAYSEVDVLPNKITPESIEKNLTFIGLVGMIDPPRDGVKEAIQECKNAGIKTVMITGDHIETARAIASNLGILNISDLSITGKELDKLSDDELLKNIMNYSVFARVSPEHKVRIVKAFQSSGAVVAMTGDGVNDAPALKNADIGISMGRSGTDVAKNASDMILIDDNFVTIVEAVKYGRNIYDNIKKAIHFSISTNIGEIVTIFVGLLLGMKSPLLAIQLLWINLVTDSLPAIALGLEPAEKDIMSKKPNENKKGLFADGLWQNIITEGTLIGVLTLLSFTIGSRLGGINVARTMAFVTLGILELVHSFNIKSEKSLFKTGLFENKYLVGAFVVGTLLQVGVACVPTVSNIFKLTALTTIEWIYTILISLFPILVMEIQKMFNKKTQKHLKFQKNVL